ncbi:hypothetical protein EIP91_011571 [Steccherinum ochraceum]|uniref:Uncharacterized protein n=1 Tax=Steccherinum ochraceum TaxID=92696 RepID=A0A4R0QZN2_9APHY|nr:hypothetical protein EIP91_011571 [Steccherinum ochraceum]
MENTMNGAHHIIIINLARQYDHPLVLPTAFYECAQLPLSTILSTVTDDTGMKWKLSDEDLKRVLEGRDQLAERRHYQLAMFIAPYKVKTSQSCRTEDSCITEMKETGHKLYSDWNKQHRHAVLSELDSHIGQRDICLSCVSMLEYAYEDHREKVWNDLVDIFDLHDTVTKDEWLDDDDDD